MKVAVLTDSTSDLTQKWQERLGLHVIPLRVQFDGKEWNDHQEIDPEYIFKRVQAGAAMPKTHPPTVEKFCEVLEDILATHDHVICVHISGVLSQTVSHAREAAQQFAGRVRVHDSMTTTMGLALRAERAIELLRQDTPLDDVLDVLELTHQYSQSVTCVDTLEYLHRGGRIGKAAALLGGMVNLKPVLGMTEHGIEPFGRAIGSRRGQSKMREILRLYAGKVAQPRVGLYHNGNEQGITAMREEIRALGLREMMTLSLGTVLSSHLGPKAYGFHVEPITVWKRAW